MVTFIEPLACQSLRILLHYLRGEFIVCVFCFVVNCSEEPGYFHSEAE